MVKLVSGFLKNTFLKFPICFKKNKYFCPTPLHIKKSVFSFFGKINNFFCLDLFCGSGHFGLEAASRNCKTSVLFEKNKNIFFFLKKNIDLLFLKNVKIYNFDFFLYFKNLRFLKYYDLVFIDTPYIKFNKLIDSIKIVLPFLKKGSYIYLETIMDLKIILKCFFDKFKILKNNFFNKINYAIFQVL